MITNFSDESTDLLRKAKTKGIGQMDPIVKEELVFFVLVYETHPLWLILRNRFKLNDNLFKNQIWNFLMQEKSHSPDDPRNAEAQERYFRRAGEEAKRSGASAVEPYHLLKAIFLGDEDNCVIRLLNEQNVSREAALEEIERISYTHLTEAVNKVDTHSSYAPSRRVMKVAEDYSAGMELSHFGRNLNELAEAGKLDPVYFRDEEIRSAIEILCRRQQNNPLLIGEAGVGKTAIAEGIAQKIVAGEVPEAMRGKEIMELSITSLVAGSTLRGQFEEKIQQVIKACSENPDLMLFIDEIHMLVGAGGERGVSDAANILKPALARGQLRCIGATTLKESRQFLEKDKALKRRFQPVLVKEPTPDQAIEILKKCKTTFEEYHTVTITEDALSAAVELSGKYVKDRYFPGKAIDLLDHTCACARIDPDSDKNVSGEQVAAIVAKDVQVPITQLLAGHDHELSLLGDRLRERVIGQDEAVTGLEGVVQLTKMGMDLNPERPEGVFLLVGPTGVGKTELARSLTTALLGDESRLVTFDMGEYKEQTSVARLVGAAPGYVGFEQESRLLSCVRSRPNSVILMDRIDNAHPDVLGLLRQVFDKGTLTAQDGETVFFSRATFILTTDLGGTVFQEKEFRGKAHDEICKEVRTAMAQAVERTFDPGFLSSIDKVIFFDPLERDSLRKILRRKMEQVHKRLGSRGMLISVPREVEDFLLEQGYSITSGAKFIDKMIEEKLLIPLTREVMTSAGRRIDCSVDNGQIVFKCRA